MSNFGAELVSLYPGKPRMPYDLRPPTSLKVHSSSPWFALSPPSPANIQLMAHMYIGQSVFLA